MAIISEYQEEERPPSTSTFNGTLDHSNPLEFLRSVFLFVSRETDFFKREAAEKEVAISPNIRNGGSPKGRKSHTSYNRYLLYDPPPFCIFCYFLPLPQELAKALLVLHVYCIKIQLKTFVCKGKGRDD